MQSKYPNLIFWGCYLVLNLLLFLPLYLLNWETSSFFPLSLTTLHHPIEAAKQLTLWRDNLDVFRINSELLLLVSLWVFIPWLRRASTRKFFIGFWGLFYFFILIYAIFESVLLTLYQADVAFYSHFQLAIDGIQVLIRNLEMSSGFYLLVGLGVLLGFGFICALINGLISQAIIEQLSPWSKRGLALLTGLVAIFLVGFQSFLASPRMQVSSFAYKLKRNVTVSTEVYQRVQAFDDNTVQTRYDYGEFALRQKPNVHLIFVESYGSVLYKRPDYQKAYTALLAELTVQLQENNWFMASTLSDAPTWGAGSWMSYTSTLFGIRVDAQPQYLSLVDEYQNANYPDLGHFFKEQGYIYIRVSSLSDELGEEKQQQLQAFYGTDLWPTYSDLDYQGHLFGWGPAPPDQYSLAYARESLLDELDRPFFFVYVTQNSHYPWVSLPEIPDDWRTLNQQSNTPVTTQPSTIPHKVKRQNYYNSIAYELRILTDYVINATNDDIFILVGDHQPPQVSRPNDTFATPIHIISRDKAFRDAFLDYGYISGLEVEDMTVTMQHEGFYSLFVRVLLSQYGDNVKTLPDYLPRGVMLSDEKVARDSP